MKFKSGDLSAFGLPSKTSILGPLGMQKFICKRCGKEYSRRFTMKADYCDECKDIVTQETNEHAQLLSELDGYQDYASSIFKHEYTMNELRQIKIHRENIIRNYKQDELGDEKMKAFLSVVEYTDNINDHFSMEDAADFLLSYLPYEAIYYPGMRLTNHVLFPFMDGTAIDIADVCAISYMQNYTVPGAKIGHRYYDLYLFTKDPYIPVISSLFETDKKLFEGDAESLSSMIDYLNNTFSVTPDNRSPEIVLDELKKSGQLYKISDENYKKLRHELHSLMGFFNTSSLIKKGIVSSPCSNTLINILGYMPEYTCSNAIKNSKCPDFWENAKRYIITGTLR